jgi:hypothetical protein
MLPCLAHAAIYADPVEELLLGAGGQAEDAQSQEGDVRQAGQVQQQDIVRPHTSGAASVPPNWWGLSLSVVFVLPVSSTNTFAVISHWTVHLPPLSQVAVYCVVLS